MPLPTTNNPIVTALQGLNAHARAKSLLAIQRATKPHIKGLPAWKITKLCRIDIAGDTFTLKFEDKPILRFYPQEVTSPLQQLRTEKL